MAARLSSAARPDAEFLDEMVPMAIHADCVVSRLLVVKGECSAYRWATLGCGVIGNELAQAMQALGGNL